MFLRNLAAILEVAFFAGIAGSLIVVVVTFVDDLREIFQPDEGTESEKPISPVVEHA